MVCGIHTSAVPIVFRVTHAHAVPNRLTSSDMSPKELASAWWGRSASTRPSRHHGWTCSGWMRWMGDQDEKKRIPRELTRSQFEIGSHQKTGSLSAIFWNRQNVQGATRLAPSLISQDFSLSPRCHKIQHKPPRRATTIRMMVICSIKSLLLRINWCLHLTKPPERDTTALVETLETPNISNVGWR